MKRGIKMKLRKGFVSNSSTSSFLIYGTIVDEDRLKQAVEKNNLLADGEDIDQMGQWELTDIVEEALGLSGLLPYDGSYGTYFGESWSSVKDEETGYQFKQRVGKKLKEFFGDDITLQTLKEAWHD